MTNPADIYRDYFDHFAGDHRHSWCADRAGADLSSGDVACGCGIVSADPCPCHWDPTITSICEAEGIDRGAGISDEQARALRHRFAQAVTAPWCPLVQVSGNWKMTDEDVRQFKAEFREAVAVASPELAVVPQVQRLGIVGEMHGYCRKCDVFAGYGALGVAKLPDEHAEDQEWLDSHCWVCGRSRQEIASDR